MASASRWVTPVASIGPVNVGTVLWRRRGELQVTVVMKALLAFRHNELMAIANAPELVARDQHVDNDPTRSLLNASDMVPYRPQADVWLTGHAHAPLGRRVAVSVVRLGLYRAGETVFEKTLHVHGDRARIGDQPTPFQRMPLVYERAYGGIGFDENPVGVGADERPLVPNIVDPSSNKKPAGFGPISRYWKLRRRQVTPEKRRSLDQAIVEVPRDFDWRYYQAAPADQRIPFLRGDEWLVLDGMHPAYMRVQTRLPKIVGVARVLPLDPQSPPSAPAMPLALDTLAIDADDESCCLTWRGTFLLSSEQELAQMLIAGALIGRDDDIDMVDWSLAYQTRRDEAHEDVDVGLKLGTSGVTVVSDGTAPDGVIEELRDPLMATTVDPPRAGEQSPHTYRRRISPGAPMRYPRSDVVDEVTQASVMEDTISASRPGGAATVRGFAPPDDPDDDRPTDSSELGSIPPGADPGITAPGAIPLALDSDTGEVTMPGRIPVPVDTEPGEPPAMPDDELPWVEEVAVEPRPVPGTVAVQRPPKKKSPFHDTVRDLVPPLHDTNKTAPGQRKRAQPRRPVPPRRDSNEETTDPDAFPNPLQQAEASRARRKIPTASAPRVVAAPRRELTSLPPGPIDQAKLEEALRRAGASEADVTAALERLDDEAGEDES